jgi:hypothetical protein
MIWNKNALTAVCEYADRHNLVDGPVVWYCDDPSNCNVTLECDGSYYHSDPDDWSGQCFDTGCARLVFRKPCGDGRTNRFSAIEMRSARKRGSRRVGFEPFARVQREDGVWYSVPFPELFEDSLDKLVFGRLKRTARAVLFGDI